MERLTMPRDLVSAAERDGRAGWLATLPETVADITARWGLEVGEPFQPGGHCAWVAPVRDRAGADLVLKVAWPHPEAEHEADGLRAWAGDGAIRLSRAEQVADANVLLLERCRPGTDLRRRSEPEQDVVVAGLLNRLWRVVPASGHPFLTLQAMCHMWADEFEARDAPDLDPGLIRTGVELFRSLPASSERHVLLATDLHAGNVLAAEREPWLVIDPKPYVGDPTYDVLQHLMNCRDRLRTDPNALLSRMAGLAGVDARRLRLWLFARCVVESDHWPALASVARRLTP
jgi:streptomycin 6-kinase